MYSRGPKTVCRGKPRKNGQDKGRVKVEEILCMSCILESPIPNLAVF